MEIDNVCSDTLPKQNCEIVNSEEKKLSHEFELYILEVKAGFSDLDTKIGKI